MRSHILKVAGGCYSVLRQLRSVRRSVPTDVFCMLVGSLVVSRLDYCNVTLAGVSTTLLRRFQSAMNAAARIITGLPRSAHISTTLANLHWLRAPERIAFKLALLAFKCLNNTGPRYLCNHFHRIADIPSRQRLRSFSTL
jgi:hypothetical protein